MRRRELIMSFGGAVGAAIVCPGSVAQAAKGAMHERIRSGAPAGEVLTHSRPG
jgi:hypothetical protein